MDINKQIIYTCQILLYSENDQPSLDSFWLKILNIPEFQGQNLDLN